MFKNYESSQLSRFRSHLFQNSNEFLNKFISLFPQFRAKSNMQFKLRKIQDLKRFLFFLIFFSFSNFVFFSIFLFNKLVKSVISKCLFKLVNCALYNYLMNCFALMLFIVWVDMCLINNCNNKLFFYITGIFFIQKVYFQQGG